MKKRYLILMAGVVFTTNAQAEKLCNCGTTATDCCWEIVGDVLTITGTGAITAKPWVYGSPDSIQSIVMDGVTSIGDSMFYGRYSVTSLTIPDSVTSIGNHAFEGMSGVTSLTIPDSVTSIGSQAFYNMNSVTGDLIIPDSVTSIGGFLFRTAAHLSSVVVPDGASIDDYAFYDMGNVTIFCPSGVECKGAKTNQIKEYIKNADGTYTTTTDNKTYASPKDMAAGPENACTTDCSEKVEQYKRDKANTMQGGALCTTQQDCYNLLTMVSDSNQTCGVSGNTKKTIAVCSSYAKDNLISLANLYSDSNNASGGTVSSDDTPKRRIYTIEEANRVAGKVNRVSITYR